MTARPPRPRLRDGTEVAAWVFKANPEVWDVEGHLARAGAVDRWPLAPGYRGDLLTAGQPALLWLTGGRAGVIAAGAVAGPAYDDHDHDQTHRRRWRRWAPVRLAAVAPARKAALLADPRFHRAEVVRLPRLGSPLALTTPELEVVEDAIGCNADW